ncbi:hypothetical protein GJV11_05770 [Enterobacteriaceae bacterium RIT693]|nr:hypothetical protein [Enterobacteriaceae bacterium RIT693]
MIEKFFSKWRCFSSDEQGTIALEFSAAIIPFIMSVLFIAEMCRVAHLSATLDLALAQSANIASTSTSHANYESYFSEEINERIRRGPLFSKNTRVQTSVVYCTNMSEFIAERCTAGTAIGRPLAVYSASVSYEPLFFIFPKKTVTNKLSRKIVLVQEFQ